MLQHVSALDSFLHLSSTAFHPFYVSTYVHVTHSSAGGPLGHLSTSAVRNDAAVNTCIHVFVDLCSRSSEARIWEWNCWVTCKFHV